MNNLAEVFRSQGKCIDNLELTEKVLDQSIPTLDSMNNLAEVFRSQEVDEGSRCIDNTGAEEKVLGQEHPPHSQHEQPSTRT
ncbi:hypothetical protein ColTof3_14893 [Colletotrichum tofieldiae]|nr:hypothetical protein ColTof3_14893 [Colletotrichum tofieldiae]